MRGKEMQVKQQPKFSGITPAYAGKRKALFGLDCSTQDHPRVCGEKFHYLYYYVYNKGSPPRMRGKDVKQAIHIMMQRITPAYAGKRRR